MAARRAGRISVAKIGNTQEQRKGWVRRLNMHHVIAEKGKIRPNDRTNAQIAQIQRIYAAPCDKSYLMAR